MNTIAPTLPFYSTNGQSPAVDLRGALLGGQAPDRGLYLPESFPQLAPGRIAAFHDLTYAQIATEILGKYTGGILEHDELAAICEDAYNYPVPVEHVYDRVHVLRLDRGPTASFKDFAARMMARLIGRFIREQNAELTILTATSGDTGSAVASAFHGVEGIRVLVLFPIDEVSLRQRKQMTTLGGNIATLAIDGKFDDCQAMVKRAFADPDLAALPLSSANSINIGRLLPQSVYYFYAASRVAKLEGDSQEPVVFSIPSGNWGNMMGCVIARKMGLPLRRIVVPVNANDEVPTFLKTEVYAKIEPSRACISNAMNVGHPSNLARLVALYGGWLDEAGTLHKAPDFDALRRDLHATSVSDEATRATLKEAWTKHHLLLEPHGAVGWRGLMDYLTIEDPAAQQLPAVSVETAHPAKFPDEIEQLLGFSPEVPETLAALENLKETYGSMGADYGAFKDHLLKNYS
jgi:threonine synthase